MEVVLLVETENVRGMGGAENLAAPAAVVTALPEGESLRTLLATGHGIVGDPVGARGRASDGREGAPEELLRPILAVDLERGAVAQDRGTIERFLE